LPSTYASSLGDWIEGQKVARLDCALAVREGVDETSPDYDPSVEQASDARSVSPLTPTVAIGGKKAGRTDARRM
jgi:hypothetical protein